MSAGYRAHVECIRVELAGQQPMTSRPSAFNDFRVFGFEVVGHFSDTRVGSVRVHVLLC